MTTPTKDEMPKAERPQPAPPAKPPGRFADGLESPGSVHC